MASPTFFSEGNTPRLRDTIWKINQKILGALYDLSGGGGGGGLSVLSQSLAGSGSPEGVVDGNPGRIYTDSDTGAKYSKLSPVGTLTGWV